MKLVKICLASLLLVSMAYAIPLNSSARSCIPGDLLQADLGGLSLAQELTHRDESQVT